MSNESAVTVRFFGICMHVSSEHLDREQVGTATEHRVILVNASSQDRINHYLPDHGIQPHFAQLQIAAEWLVDPQPPEPEWFPRISAPGSSASVWSLNGVTLTIEGAIGQQSSEIARCIPRLHDYAKPEPPPLSDSNRGAAGVASDTACFFDFPRVDVQGESTEGEASVGVITVTVPTGTPGIKVTSFGGETFFLPLQPGAAISVSNSPEDVEDDNDADFLLYFLATDRVPADADHPRTGPGWVPCGKRNPDYGMAGPGCSNSLYP